MAEVRARSDLPVESRSEYCILRSRAGHFDQVDRAFLRTASIGLRHPPGQARCRMARYGKKAASKVKRAMHERKRGSLRSGRSGRKVKSKKQAIAIGLSEARRSGAKVPRKRSSARKRTSGRKKK
jgi:hypothetical protein